MTFTPGEQEFLRNQPIGRLCTIGANGDPQIRPVGVHIGSDGMTIDIVGHTLASTQKWRNVISNPRVAFIVDEVVSVKPPRAHGIEVRGLAEALAGRGSTDDGLSGDIIRITPRRIISWGIDGPQTRGRETGLA
ncbi:MULTISPECIES: PPOX class F420-dependent oxidoreductase [Mycobacteroides]|uniref:Pyridoxamine 5'-phosphate oxidase n=1 Tax=Mycobacteroides chelonae TaxID=1774 RepID=A0A1S1LVX2_MYCCH|nr:MULTISPECIES: PPOX class F420-dependent oxidoreductase [Mycobacteroides]KRQ19253.1 pyridoxamine 5'-phosphate oxidase [Mycobacteroides sp. H003]KRQ34494.1 pyridoxamine 5'-phosphate oxidase [Mycobacteroides sp. H092]KRQ41478.1 pyridoxamine 5'-phosphate oxidase [Mycobacteroides sp. H101]KRQ43430.1 pyridoxamine 5'-phosphate oxidase [Mycobacteroides sp. H063]KRQ58063.1 pyridoxamine 5'-phosphate oxidase [Mycobacteroides sp. HXVII]